MVSFLWKVATSGYMWKKEFHSPEINGVQIHHRGKGGILIPKRWEFRTYEPLKQYAGLFREFVATPTTRDGILAFANRYGHIGEGGWECTAMRDPRQNAGEDLEEHWDEWSWFTVPQSFSDWVDRIERMSEVVKLWDQFRAAPTDDECRCKLQVAIDRELIDVRVAARFEIAPPPSNQPSLHLIPNTLLGAIWLQLARAVEGNKELRQCGGCGRWFELGPETARKSKNYCSTACRSRAYRGRKEAALRLAAEGKKTDEIANLIGVSSSSIKGWLADMS